MNLKPSTVKRHVSKMSLEDQAKIASACMVRITNEMCNSMLSKDAMRASYIMGKTYEGLAMQKIN